MRPQRIFLVRHGESTGNLDKGIYKSVPDYAIALTPKGVDDARNAGVEIKNIIGNEKFALYYSPFLRTYQTACNIVTGMTEQLDRNFVYEEPRLREQEWCGKLREDGFMHEAEAERDAYGHFYYRFNGGESCADVYDRVSDFIGALFRDFEKHYFPKNVIIATHGTTMRVFLMRWFHMSVREFETLAKPDNGEVWVLEKQRISLLSRLLGKKEKYIFTSPIKKYKESRHIYILMWGRAGFSKSRIKYLTRRQYISKVEYG